MFTTLAYAERVVVQLVQAKVKEKLPNKFLNLMNTVN